MNYSLKERKKSSSLSFSLKNLYFRPLTPDVSGAASWRPRKKSESRKLTFTFSYKDFNEYMKVRNLAGFPQSLPNLLPFYGQ